jgi:hypothetical protein
MSKFKALSDAEKKVLFIASKISCSGGIIHRRLKRRKMEARILKRKR